jgi:hypothetical protein
LVGVIEKALVVKSDRPGHRTVPAILPQLSPFQTEIAFLVDLVSTPKMILAAGTPGWRAFSGLL